MSATKKTSKKQGKRHMTAKLAAYVNTTPGWHGMNWIRPAKRQAIYCRDGDRCCYCLVHTNNCDERMTLDHVIARELGGTNDAENLVMACLTCNCSKGAMSAVDFAQVLADRGINPVLVARRIKERTARKLNMAEGRKRAGVN